MAKSTKPKTIDEARRQMEHWEAKRAEAERILRDLEEQERRREAERIAGIKDQIVAGVMGACGYDDLDDFWGRGAERVFAALAEAASADSSAFNPEEPGGADAQDSAEEGSGELDPPPLS